MDSKKSFLMVLGVIAGMVFVWGLDFLTTRYPAKLRFDFLPWKVARYSIIAEIDSLTVMDKEGGKVPLRNRYAEEMELSCYYFNMKKTGKRVMMLELLSKKIEPKSITVAGVDETAQRGPKFAARMPAPWYVFLDFEKDGAIKGQRRTAGIRDMIVSTYFVRRLPKGQILTGDTWSGDVDMGPFITTYKWQFDELRFTRERERLADISGEGEFYEELSGGGKGEKLGSYTYSYTIDLGRNKACIRRGGGSFDLQSRKLGTGTSYRENYKQKLLRVESIPPESQKQMREQFEMLKEVVEQKELGDLQAFHDGLYFFLRRYPGSPLWDNILILLDDLRVKCGEEPATKEDILQGKKPELKKEKE
jgi:hypothetical protein